jgi:hypothetical protein
VAKGFRPFRTSAPSLRSVTQTSNKFTLEASIKEKSVEKVLILAFGQF